MQQKIFIYLTILLLDVTFEGCGRFGAQYVCSALQQHRETQLAILQQADRQDLSVPCQDLHQAQVASPSPGTAPSFRYTVPCQALHQAQVASPLP